MHRWTPGELCTGTRIDDAKSMQNEPNFNVDMRENGKSLGSELYLMRKARLFSFQRHPTYEVDVTVP